MTALDIFKALFLLFGMNAVIYADRNVDRGERGRPVISELK